MDERLAKALEFSNYRLTLHNQTENIKNILKDKLTIYENQGKFTANSGTLCYIDLISRLNKTNTCIVVDDDDNPIKIVDLKKFKDKLSQIHLSAYEEYYHEKTKLSRARNMKKLLDLEENE